MTLIFNIYNSISGGWRRDTVNLLPVFHLVGKGDCLQNETICKQTVNVFIDSLWKSLCLLRARFFWWKICRYSPLYNNMYWFTARLHFRCERTLSTDRFCSDTADNLFVKANHQAHWFNKPGLFDTIHSFIMCEVSIRILSVYWLFLCSTFHFLKCSSLGFLSGIALSLPRMDMENCCHAPMVGAVFYMTDSIKIY